MQSDEEVGKVAQAVPIIIYILFNIFFNISAQRSPYLHFFFQNVIVLSRCWRIFLSSMSVYHDCLRKYFEMGVLWDRARWNEFYFRKYFP